MRPPLGPKPSRRSHARATSGRLLRRRVAGFYSAVDIVRDLIQTVVIGKTPGHQPASLQVHGDIAHIMASMDVIDVMQQQFVAAAQNDLLARIASGELDTEQKRKKLLSEYAEELLKKFPEWENLQVSVVAGAGFEPAAFRL